MSIFEYLSYKDYVRAWVAQRPAKGRGAYRRMAEQLGVNSTMISQIINGDKNLNLEMASELAGHLSLNESEERYLFLLVEVARAGSEKLKSKLKKQISEAQQNAQSIRSRVIQNQSLSAESKATYYSSWIYSGIRHLLATPGVWTPYELAERLRAPEAHVQEALQFLLNQGFAVWKDGQLQSVMGRMTHLEAEDPLVILHHHNWRIRGLQKIDQRQSENLFYTAPMSLSAADAEVARRLLLDLVQSINRLVAPSTSEVVRCLNLDWFEI